MSKKTILFVHQSAELYGSDKSMLALAAGLDRDKYTPIVVLPDKGPLLDKLTEAGIRTHILPLARISRSVFNIRGLFGFAAQCVKSVKAFNKTFSKDRIDLVHTNTLAVFTGALWAKLKGIKHLWHVREIILRPAIARRIFTALLRIFSWRIVTNSRATRDVIVQDCQSLAARTVAVWNGIEPPPPPKDEDVKALREELSLEDGQVLAALVGRFNRWKGQSLLVEAAEILQRRGVENLRYLLIGSPPDGQEHFRDDLQRLVSESSAASLIKILDFRDDIWTVWQACDICVVPSTEPEPFGRVAVEAMCLSKPVVAAAHGGLTEIVVHGETGCLFSPCDAEGLANCLNNLAQDEKKRYEYGQNGLLRVRDQFSLESYVSSFDPIYDDI